MQSPFETYGINGTGKVENEAIKKVWVAPYFEIISKDIIESGTSVSVEGGHTSHSS